MRCVRCNSTILTKFVDGEGNRRVFCKKCGVSFLEHSKILPNGQKNLLKYDNGLYYRPGIVHNFR